MRMNALGAKPSESAAAAPRPAKGSCRLSIKPPPAAAAVRRNMRRERLIAALDCSARSRSVLSLRVIVGLLVLGLRGLLYGFANPHIGPAAADVAGQGGIDVGIARAWIARQQRRGRHDLPRLAVAALHDLTVEPGLLDLGTSRRSAYGLDRRDL